MQEYNVINATIADIHAAMLAGTLTCRALVEAYLKRIAAYDQSGPKLNAVIRLNPKALATADQLDQNFKHTGLTGPLHGIPVLLKDNIDTADMVTTGGSVCLSDHQPAEDAFITARLLAAGAIILAKVNLHEFAVWGETASSLAGQTLNPYDLTRTPGGSSGGTGAGVAAAFGTVGIGTDTINSIRSPASANCLAGLRPTVGLVSRGGIIPYSLTQDTAGPIALCVRDAAIIMDAIAGYDPQDGKTAWAVGHIPDSYCHHLHTGGLKGKRLGVLHSFFGTKPEHQDVNNVMAESIAVLRAGGAEVIDIAAAIDSNRLVTDVSVHLHDLNDDLNSYLATLEPQSPAHSLAEILRSGKYHPGIEANIRQAVGLAKNTPEYRERLVCQSEVRDQIMKLMADYKLDALVYPHQKRLVVPVGETQVERNGVLAAVTGFPAFTLPAGFSPPTATAPGGVPVGIEFFGRPWSEPLLFTIAYAFEQANPVQKPPRSTPAL
ncbi:MAG: amidase family protein [Negativicutes bacterium]|nr:amidase family protein [Negativicutes bacterium]